ncbi:hypothetical protein ACFYWY_16530 [Streptomyces sp. NPDC002870]|uniref:hypothetical protein n=1 Tax=Streptomyces sp. NPDC002870 TaxID=3364666 RepID=UPI0036B36BA2
MTEEWGNAVGPANREAPDLTADPLERFEKTWEQIIAAFDAGRAVWKLSGWSTRRPRRRRRI